MEGPSTFKGLFLIGIQLGRLIPAKFPYYSPPNPGRFPLAVTFIDSTSLSVAVLIALAVVFSIFRIMSASRRSKALREIAARLDLTLERENWTGSSRAPQLESPLFEKGEEEKFQNIMSGLRGGMTANFFDYTFRRRRSTTSQTVAAFTQDIWLPTFEVAPLGIVAKLGATASSRNIQFDFDPGFSKRFRLQGPDEERVRKLFTRRVVSFLEGIDSRARWHFEGSDFTLILYRRGEIVKPADFSRFVQETTEMAKAFLGLDRY